MASTINPDNLVAQAHNSELVYDLRREFGKVQAENTALQQGVANPQVLQTVRQRTNAFESYGGTLTFASLWALESAYDLVRLVYLNDSASVAATIDRFMVAPTAKVNDGFNPVYADNSAVSWTAGTGNNAGANVLYGAQATGATSSFTIPVSTVATNPSLAATDWVAVSSLARADSGETLPLLMVRDYSATATRGPSQTASHYVTDWPLVNRGRIIRGFYKSGDFVTTPSGFTTPTEGSYVHPVAVQTYARGFGHVLMTLGDSLTQGFLTAAAGNGYGFQAACALSTATMPVSNVNSGVAGQAHAALIQRGYREFDMYRPTAVVIETSSPNSFVATQAYFDGEFAAALAFAHYVESQGSVPILKTATPFSYGTVADAFRKECNARVNAIGASGRMLTIDASAAVTDGATPAKVRAEFLASDSAHINDAGHAAIAAASLPTLRVAFGIA